jgi:MFS family permease
LHGSIELQSIESHAASIFVASHLSSCMVSRLTQTENSYGQSIRWFAMVTLIVAGEAIFFLPFVLARVFRPTMLEVFQIGNLELGLAFSAYGVIAMLAYFPGGPLADVFSPRKLMFAALFSTAAGGLMMATIPSLSSLKWLYAYWGLTTILLFWAALIRATRQLGGETRSGTAFGMLDGGRGLVAAASGTLAVLIFASLLPADVESATLAQRTDAFRQVILVFTAITLAAAVLVWLALPDTSESSDTQQTKINLHSIATVFRMPMVWLQAVIIVCAYVAYKGLDDVSLYAKEVLGYDEVSSAYTSTVSMWIRPAAAIMAGLIADRTRVSLMTSLSFGVVMIGCGVLATGLLQPDMTTAFFVTIIATSAAVFALRGLYFAIMQEGSIPITYTGTVVGIVSAVGYTPDIFMGPLMGKLLDDSPGALGHQHVFTIVAFFAAAGLIAALCYPRMATLKADN